jgi:Flp pilus assembly protein TadG
MSPHDALRVSRFAPPPDNAAVTPTSRGADQRGSALVELSWLAILLLLPVLWIVMSVFQVQRGAFGVSAAARAAARAYSLAPDDATGLVRARTAARVALDDQGVHGVTPDVRVTCTPYPADCHQGTSVITVSVHSRVVLPMMPTALGSNRPSFALDATQTVPIGQFQAVADG